MNRKRQVLKYVLADIMSASSAWFILWVFRKKVLELNKLGEYANWEFGEKFFYGLVFFPFFWVSLYVLSGHYKRIYRKHRLKELVQTLLTSVFGVLLIFFLFLLDDEISSYKNYYQSLLVLFSSQFGLTFLLRFILTSSTVHKVHKGIIGFNTLIVGGNENAVEIYQDIQGLKKSPGFRFIGYVKVNGKDDLLSEHLPYLGQYQQLPELINTLKIEEIIIAIGTTDHKYLQQILNELEDIDVNVKIIPDIYDILTGSVKMTSIFGAPLIEIKQQIMPEWQFSVKRMMDICVSIAALILLFPVYLVTAILIKMNSTGPIFFSQERIGIHGKPFNIYKFRTMVTNAEKEGPQLSSTRDPRITGIGRFLRKTRLDELPQFFNVLKGDMALVGPRPERMFFIKQIMERAPHYRHLQKVKPGITSWGQVKYGYAENVDQMIQRLKYDIIYIENMSLSLDIKILAYTVLIVLKGVGK